MSGPGPEEQAGGPDEQGRHGQHGQHGEDVGSVAEEAAKLLGALSEWAGDQRTDWATGVSGAAGQAAAAARQVHEHLDEGIATGAEECRYCPVCRGIGAVRQLSPEVRAHLTTAASSLLQAVAGVMATQVPEEHRGPDRRRAHDQHRRPDQQRRPGRAGVERIPLDDDETPDDRAAEGDDA